MPPTRPLVAAAALASLLSSSAPASAVVDRSCGPDPVANTAAVLCAPPSGPCDATSVVVSASIRVVDGRCVFDLGGRDLRVERTLQVVGGNDGGFALTNAGDVTVARAGRLKSRGDSVRTNGAIREGGPITIASTGAITVAGTMDTSGEYGGVMWLTAQGDVTVARTAKIRSNGIGGAVDVGARLADGGSLSVEAHRGSISYAGKIEMRGANGGTGGDVDLTADRDLDVNGKIDVSGGNGDGGLFFGSAGDDARFARAFVDARSRAGGADGGLIDLVAGVTYGVPAGAPPPDRRPGGTLSLTASRFDMRGSVNDKGLAGGGGEFAAYTLGSIIGADDVVIRADGAGSTIANDGGGGLLSFYTDGIPADPASGQEAVRGDITLGGLLSARGGGVYAFGGDVTFGADRDLVLRGTIDVGARTDGGTVYAGAGRNALVSGRIDAGAAVAGSRGGTIRLVAGFSEVGALRVADDVRAAGDFRIPEEPSITLTGCPVTVDPGVTIDTGDGDGSGGSPKLAFFSGRPLQLGAGSRFLAGSDGIVTATHPRTQDPIVGAGVVFDPGALLTTVVPAEYFPLCPRCGDGPDDTCAPTARLETYTPYPDRIDILATLTSPVGLPLSGDIAVCDGTGIEDVTFTWAATTCEGVHDTLELTINDIVVADVSAQVDGGCACFIAPPFAQYRVPFDVVSPLLVPGLNRFGVRKSSGEPGRERTDLAWIYATVTTSAGAERVPIFDAHDMFEPVGHSSYDSPYLCNAEGREWRAIDRAGEAVVCNAVSAADWTGTLPCSLDITPLPEDQDFTLVLRATDGVATTPIVSVGTIPRRTEPVLTFYGCDS